MAIIVPALKKTQARNLTILLGSITTILAATLISPVLPEMAAEFEDVPNVDLLVRLTLTVPALFIGVGALIAGFLLDRLGRKPVLVAALILYGIAGTLGFVLDSLSAILMSRALLGIAVAGTMSGFTTLVLDYFEGEERNKFMGYVGAFVGFGGMASLLAAGFLADISWRYPFLIHLFAFIVLPGLIFAIDEPERQVKSLQETTSAERVPFPLWNIAPMYFAAFIGLLIFFIFPVEVPFFLTEQTNASSSQVGLALSLQTLASALVALLYNRLKARLSFQGIFALIFIAFSINHVMLALTASYNLTVLGLVISGLGIGLLLPNCNIWLDMVIAPGVRGRAVGGLTSMLFVGQFISPFVTQPLVKNLGIANMFLVAGGGSFFLALGYAWRAVNQPANPVLKAKNVEAVR